MKLVKTCPDIPDDWKGGVTEVASLLGMSRTTLLDKCSKKKRDGGIVWGTGRGGRKVFTGKEVKRFWKSY